MQCEIISHDIDSGREMYMSWAKKYKFTEIYSEI